MQKKCQNERKNNHKIDFIGLQHMLRLNAVSVSLMSLISSVVSLVYIHC